MCPKCNGRTKVARTDHLDTCVVLRARRCKVPACRYRFLTVEVPDGHEISDEMRAGLLAQAEKFEGFPGKGNGIVYAFENEQMGIVKIGFTRDLDGRRKALSGACGVNLGTVAVFEGKSRSFEKMLHDRFAEQRGIGEWFSASIKDEIIAMAAKDRDGQ